MLICDDVAAMRLLLNVIVGLNPDLHVAGEARDGNEAVSEARRLQPDVVVLDLSMPARSGLDALPDIRRVAPASVVIAFTGLDESVVGDAARAAGAASFVQKGTDPDA
ncbi:MAG: response regulator, partial [Gaiellaceae bacterium]